MIWLLNCMKSVSEIKDCYGCGVCAASCGRNAISMKLNSVGFYGPNVNKQLCVDCGLCVDVCSFLKDDVEKEGILVPKFFASWSNDENIRNICSSGGVGYEIESVVNNGVQISNECTCIWCCSKMRCGGTNRIGAGFIVLRCDNWGAVAVNACQSLWLERKYWLWSKMGCGIGK